MKVLISLVWGIIIGLILVLWPFKHYSHIPVGRAMELVHVCERKLPRNTQCELVAVEKKNK